MTDELKDKIKEEEKNKTEDPQKVEERISDLTHKLETLKNASEQEKKELAEKLKATEYERDFEKVSAKYPHAKEFEKDIKAKVAAGLSVEDASVVILNQNKKLMTSEEVNKENAEALNQGGSADNLIPKGKKPSSEMTQEERLAELRELEAKGELKLVE